MHIHKVVLTVIPRTRPRAWAQCPDFLLQHISSCAPRPMFLGNLLNIFLPWLVLPLLKLGIRLKKNTYCCRGQINSHKALIKNSGPGTEKHSLRNELILCMLSHSGLSTLCTSMHCSPQGSPVLGIFQARILEWVAVSYSRLIFLTQGSNPGLLCFLHWQADSLPLAPLESLLLL